MGGTDTEYVGYDFTGNPLKRKHVHTASGKTTRTEEYSYSYDGSGRLMNETMSLGDKTVPTSHSYDQFGRPASVQHNSKAALKTSYSYNVRSWLSAQTGSLFGQNLTYDSGGNIATQQWTQNGNTRTYTYGYDGLERLKSAANSGSGNFATAYTYDKAGNVKTLQRYNSSLIDNLTYTLSGNRVTKVEDATGNAAGFKNGSTATTEYTYDNNGNLTQDLNKGISNITYNSLNLPSVVTFSNGNTITYTYASDGRKLRTAHKVGSTTTTTDYAGNVVYENGVQKKLLTQHGYVDLTDSKHYFYIKDHLGNTRVVADEGGSAKEQNEYYPFGLSYTATSFQPYKYNGKELDTKAGLNWYDYGARHYDAALGRFTTQDPLAEKYYATSPYGYCLNNPVKYIDPDGSSTWVMQNSDGTYRVVGGNLNDNDLNIYSINFQLGSLSFNPIGMSLTATSFYNSDANDGKGAWAIGSIINPYDDSGRTFLNDFISNTPEIGYYMENATGGELYDFKRTNGTPGGDKNLDMYRGMPISTFVYASARDIGNYAAGYITGLHGSTWGLTRYAFDKLQSKQDGRYSVEGLSSQNAQYIGWKRGNNDYLYSLKGIRAIGKMNLLPILKYLIK